MPLSGRERLCAMLPQSGTMCLIDEVLEWDQTGIVCRTWSHREPTNPLRFRDTLPGICAVEYFGQATYLHGALAARELMQAGGRAVAPPIAFIAAVRGLELGAERLDLIEGPLTIRARCEAFNMDASSYSFAIEADGGRIVSGRVTAKIVWGGMSP